MPSLIEEVSDNATGTSFVNTNDSSKVKISTVDDKKDSQSSQIKSSLIYNDDRFPK